MLIYDLKSNFGTLRQSNALYELEEDQSNHASLGLWNTNPPTTLRHEQSIPIHEYQRHLEAGLPAPQIPNNSVRFWSDFNRVFYHPRSLVQVRDNDLQARLGPFEDWDVGHEIFDNLERENGDLLDSDLRPFVEESDQMQGLQVITGADDAWGGFASRYAERLRDEYGKSVVWIFGLEDARPKPRVSRTANNMKEFCLLTKELKRNLQFNNLVKSINDLSTQASIYIPICNIPVHSPSYLSLESPTPWQTSALQMAGIESITLPSRLRLNDPSRASLADLETVFTSEGNRNILELSVSAKDPNAVNGEVNGSSGDHRMQSGASTAADVHEDYEDSNSDQSLDISLFRTGDSVLPSSAYGLGATRRAHIFSQLHVQRGKWAAPIPSLEAVGDRSDLNRRAYNSSHLFPNLSSYPQIFQFHQHNRAEQIAVQTALKSSSKVAQKLRDIADLTRRAIGLDQRETVYSNLKAMAEEYVDGWESDGESGDSEYD